MKPDAFVLRGLLVAGLCVFAPPAPALAAGVVGTGTPASCTEAALNTALAGGGSITFNCGGTAQINFTGAKSITVNTTLDGGGMITLSGQDATRLFVVSNGSVLTLRNIYLTDGYSVGDGGAIYNGALGSDTPGSVVIENSRISSSRSGQSGGAIVSTGLLTITNSVFETNEALNGGALYPRFAGARTTISNTVFLYNRATDTFDGWGGAILVWEGASVTIVGSDFDSNEARAGGGIFTYANSAVDLSDTTLNANTASYAGGGLENFGTAALTDTIVSRNSAVVGGGLFNQSVMRLRDVTLSDNTAQYGGGLMNFAGSTTPSPLADLIGVTFSGNGGGDEGGGMWNSSLAQVRNVTFSANGAHKGGGLFNATGTVEMSQITFFGNAADLGGAAIFGQTGEVLINKSIVANSSGSSCAGLVASGGLNLATDPTCTGFTPVVDAMLMPLADNGGPTQTHLPQPGSPAIDRFVTGCALPATDQRGLARPADGNGDGVAACDSGAVERQAAGPELLLRLFLSALSR